MENKITKGIIIKKVEVPYENQKELDDILKEASDNNEEIIEKKFVLSQKEWNELALKEYKNEAKIILIFSLIFIGWYAISFMIVYYNFLPYIWLITPPMFLFSIPLLGMIFNHDKTLKKYDGYQSKYYDIEKY